MRQVENWVQRNCTAAVLGFFGSRAQALDHAVRLLLRPIHSASSLHPLFCATLNTVVVMLVFCGFFLSNEKSVSFLHEGFLNIMWHKLRSMKVSLQSCILCIKNLCVHHLNSSIDVAIGAPQEDDLRGAIYIYNGRADGILPTFSQVGGDNSILKRSIGNKSFFNFSTVNMDLFFLIFSFKYLIFYSTIFWSL